MSVLEEAFEKAFESVCREFDICFPESEEFCEVRDVAVQLVLMELEADSCEKVMLQTLEDGLIEQLSEHNSDCFNLCRKKQVPDFLRKFAIRCKRIRAQEQQHTINTTENGSEASEKELLEHSAEESDFSTKSKEPSDTVVTVNNSKNESKLETCDENCILPKSIEVVDCNNSNSTPWFPKKRREISSTIKPASAGSTDFLCSTSDLFLLHMGARKPILKNAKLELMKNKSYALVGDNGVGKSSLLAMIREGKVAGLKALSSEKKSLKMIDVPDIDFECSLTVKEYFGKTMKSKFPNWTESEESLRILNRVGFINIVSAGSTASATTNETAGAAAATNGNFEPCSKRISDLSGGWRMRLGMAILLADTSLSLNDSSDLLLLLDEPTNHLDRNAVIWLQKFLNSDLQSELLLKKSENINNKFSLTKLIVSHDFQFLDEVCQDCVIEIKELQLHYYCGGVFHYFESTGKSYYGGSTTTTTTTTVSNSSKSEARSLETSTNCTLLVNLAVAKDTAASSLRSTGNQILADARPLLFPAPDLLESGWRSTACVLELKNVSFAYDDAAPRILQDINLRLTLESKVGLVGANGSGKSTLMKLLSRDLDIVKAQEVIPDQKIGSETTISKKKTKAAAKVLPSISRHRNLRIAYVSQDPVAVLNDNLDSTALSYIRSRYTGGYDNEIQCRIRMELQERDKLARADKVKTPDKKKRKTRTLLELALDFGADDGPGCRVEEIVGRQIRGADEVFYEVVWNDEDFSLNGRSGYNPHKPCKTANRGNHSDASTKLVPNSYEPYWRLCKMGVSDLCHGFDLREQSRLSGLCDRPVWDDNELTNHLRDFGLEEDLTAHTLLKNYSQGQKARLVLAAALWIKPHCLLLDEPTNYIDSDTLETLEKAIAGFNGAVVVISHDQGFVARVSKKIVKLEGGKLGKT